MNYTELKIVRFFDELYLSKGIFERKKRVIDEDEVFSEKEQEILINYFKNKPTAKNLGLLLQFQTGMRIGEISAIKKEDVLKDSIFVHRTEEKLFDEETGKSYIDVVDTTKTSAGERYVLLPDVAKETIRQVMSLDDSEYLFSVEGKRITTRMFRRALKFACEKNGIKYKCTHKIRKTYASTLIANDVDENIVKQMLGHTNILTTHSIYNFSTMGNGEKLQELNRAIVR